MTHQDPDETRDDETRDDETRDEATDRETPSSSAAKARSTRRAFLIGVPAVVGAGVVGKAVWKRNEGFRRASVLVTKASSYDGHLVDTIQRGLAELGIDRRRVQGKSVLLKPNLVKPLQGDFVANTHPVLVRAVAEAFRRLDAGEVLAGEAQAMYRDSSLVVHESLLGRGLAEDGIRLVDLNYDDVCVVPNRLGFSRLERFYLPKTLRRADLVVSLPKMKTHHWAGATLSMKNLFGVMPGMCYGWPKNVLHWAGIPQSVLDLTHAVRPHLAIVDGILGMEGDGPLKGTPKRANVIVMGTNLPAVDATAVRLMGLDPWRVPYLAVASGRLGPVRARHIEQRGESLDKVASRFELFNHPVVTKFWA